MSRFELPSVKIEIVLLKSGSIKAILTCHHWLKPKEIIIGSKQWKKNRYREYHERILVQAKKIIFNVGLELTSEMMQMKAKQNWNNENVFYRMSKDTRKAHRGLDEL